MRKMQRLLLLLSTAALTLATTACSNDKDDNGGNGGGITPTEGVTTEAFYKGDLYGAGTGNLWINFISDIEYNASAGDYTGIPSGTYTVIDALTADDYDVNTLLSGVYEPAYGGYFGAWYFSTTGKVEASLRSGTVTITNRGGNEYTFEIDLKDGYGHRVTGSYAGVCRVEDWS